MFHPDADDIRKDAPTPSNVPPAINVAYGRYLARLSGCMDCHGAHLSGGTTPGGVTAPNLSASGDLGHWTFKQFTRTLRTGRRPDGTLLSGAMPWREVGQMTDDELLAIYLSLRSTPPGPSGAR
jgi:mono/diheme cytochrome c family protein